MGASSDLDSFGKPLHTIRRDSPWTPSNQIAETTMEMPQSTDHLQAFVLQKSFSLRVRDVKLTVCCQGRDEAVVQEVA